MTSYIPNKSYILLYVRIGMYSAQLVSINREITA